MHWAAWKASGIKPKLSACRSRVACLCYCEWIFSGPRCCQNWTLWCLCSCSLGCSLMESTLWKNWLIKERRAPQICLATLELAGWGKHDVNSTYKNSYKIWCCFSSSSLYLSWVVKTVISQGVHNTPQKQHFLSSLTFESLFCMFCAVQD